MTSVQAVRFGPVSVRYSRRLVVVGLTALALTVLAAAAHIGFGGTTIPYPTVLRALFLGDVDPATQLAVTEFRAPRMVAALVVGAALAASGAITQTIARNPLASPDILGVTAGASAGAVGVLILAGGGAAGVSGVAATLGMPVAAFAGGLAAGLGTYVLAYRNGIDSYRLILVGLGISGFGTAVTTWMLTLGDVTSAAQALTWMTGSLNGKDWTTVTPMAAVAVALLAGATWMQRWLLLTALDEDVAIGLGLRLTTVRAVGLVLAVLLAAVATVIAGPLVFVALASPQIARLLARTPVPSVPVSALVGAVFVLVADSAAANLLSVSLPAGVATAVLGAPYLIHLVLRSQRRS